MLGKSVPDTYKFNIITFTDQLVQPYRLISDSVFHIQDNVIARLIKMLNCVNILASKLVVYWSQI